MSNMTSTETLFRPFELKSLSMANRIVMSPMSRSFAVDRSLTQASVDYYRRRAEGGVGLILSEGAGVNRPASMNEPTAPDFHGDKPLAGWGQVVKDVHSVGGRMGAQIMHAGSVKSSATDWEPTELPESPSGIVSQNGRRGRRMTEEAIADTVKAFARAAVDAKLLGFDTVEIHGAHGYLVDQFFWSVTNQRVDHYGGETLKERTRFAAEIVAEIRTAVGAEFPIIMRVSQWKGQDYNARLAETPGLMADWLVPLVEAGVDILHCSQRRFWEPEFPEIDGKDGLNFAGWAKKLTGAATISVGSVGLSGDVVSAFAGEDSTPTGLEDLVRRLERYEFDMIAVGRALVADSDWVRKVRGGDYAGMKTFKAAMLNELV
jgi:2,4-dienoyl-CoA reductase-like NADH-dependent reductase (Old Yellow Enzyme family)